MTSAPERIVDIVPFWGTLEATVKRYFKSSMDTWLRGGNIKSRFHGWNKEGADDYRGCFVFKKTGKKFAQRIYGFLCNPKSEEPRFQLCVLAHGLKAKRVQNTDKAILNKLLKLKQDCDPTALFLRLLKADSEGREQ